jgi:capsular exopolysaccharide synthesis family protein
MKFSKHHKKLTEVSSKSLVTVNEPTSFISESYKMLRTNINYMNVDTDIQVILVTSSTAGEGKTTTSTNMAITFAKTGKKTLLIECDLRKARVHKICSLPQEPGLTNILTDKTPMSAVIKKIDSVDNLDIITSGHLPPAPAELLASHALEKLIDEARTQYDTIILDAPPVLNVTDAAILQRVADGIILVVSAGETKKEAVRQAKRNLDKVNARVLGVVLTKIDQKSKGYYYYGYMDYYSKEDVKNMNKKKKSSKNSSSTLS